jgi:hypothetical protein
MMDVDERLELDLRGVPVGQFEYRITKALFDRTHKARAMPSLATWGECRPDDPPSPFSDRPREFRHIYVSPWMNDALRSRAPWNNPNGGILFCNYMDGKGPRMKFGDIVVEVDAKMPPHLVILTP